MKNELKEIFRSMPTMTGEISEQWIELMELPDDKFDIIYPEFRQSLLSAYTSTDFQQKILDQLEMTPVEDIAGEKEVIEQFIHEINQDPSLSAKKKSLLEEMFNAVLNVLISAVNTGRLNIKVGIVKLNPDAIIPQYAHPTDAGADICAIEETKLEPGETKIVKTGIAVAIPAGYEIQVRPRSGLSLKSGLRIANAPGTIDAEYRGEIGVIMTNTKDIPYVIDKGMKIAQLVIAPTPMIKWEEVATVEELGTTSRGADGFGSTDKAVSKS